ncbi:MAG: hypothetical protein AAGI52_04020 [Bacteroidota bacterium]
MARRFLSLTLLFIPLAAPAQPLFGDNCHLTIEREITQVPFDNVVKYGTLLVLAGFPETSPAAVALGREEVTSDVRVAALKGAAECLRDPETREQALRIIALAKATDDWASFAFDLRNATGLGPEDMLGSQVLAKLSIGSAILDDLGAGGKAVRDGYDALGGQRTLSFQTSLQIHGDLARQFGANCQWNASAQLADAARAMVRQRRPGAVTEMMRASQAMVGQPITSEADLLAFNPRPYLDSQARDVGDFLRARGDYLLSDRILADLEALRGEIETSRPQMDATQQRVGAHLRDARRALDHCDVARMRTAMTLVSREPGVLASTPINRSVSLLVGVLSEEQERLTDADLRLSLAGSNGCWGTSVQTYNDLVGTYYSLRDINVPGRDEYALASTLARGRRALGACDENGARQALADARATLPPTLDPGNLCIDAARATDNVDAFEREITPAISACTAAPSPSAAAVDGFVTCPEPPRWFELVDTTYLFDPDTPPGQIKREEDGYSGEVEGEATCRYQREDGRRDGFKLVVHWYEQVPEPRRESYCSREERQPLIQQPDIWVRSPFNRFFNSEEWLGPYEDRMITLGSSFPLVYSSHQRAAFVRMYESTEGVFGYDYANYRWRGDAANHILQEVAPYAWQCP